MPSCGNKMLGDDSGVESPSIYVRTCPCEGGTSSITNERTPQQQVSSVFFVALRRSVGMFSHLCNCIKKQVIISIKATNYLSVISIVQKSDLTVGAAAGTQKVLHAKRNQA